MYTMKASIAKKSLKLDPISASIQSLSNTLRKNSGTGYTEQRTKNLKITHKTSFILNYKKGYK